MEEAMGNNLSSTDSFVSSPVRYPDRLNLQYNNYNGLQGGRMPLMGGDVWLFFILPPAERWHRAMIPDFTRKNELGCQGISAANKKTCSSSQPHPSRGGDPSL
jgi:hypothetical protein